MFFLRCSSRVLLGFGLYLSDSRVDPSSGRDPEDKTDDDDSESMAPRYRASTSDDLHNIVDTRFERS
jgi:hypothetical protein